MDSRIFKARRYRTTAYRSVFGNYKVNVGRLRLSVTLPDEAALRNLAEALGRAMSVKTLQKMKT